MNGRERTGGEGRQAGAPGEGWRKSGSVPAPQCAASPRLQRAQSGGI